DQVGARAPRYTAPLVHGPDLFRSRAHRWLRITLDYPARKRALFDRTSTRVLAYQVLETIRPYARTRLRSTGLAHRPVQARSYILRQVYPVRHLPWPSAPIH